MPNCKTDVSLWNHEQNSSLAFARMSQYAKVSMRDRSQEGNQSHQMYYRGLVLTLWHLCQLFLFYDGHVGWYFINAYCVCDDTLYTDLFAFPIGFRLRGWDKKSTMMSQGGTNGWSVCNTHIVFTQWIVR